MLRWLVMGVAVAAACALLLSQSVESCNEAVCASVVSKCMITQSCKCDLTNCSCCKECSNCLSYLYTECCSCVDMCPKPNYSTSRLSTDSQVSDLPEAIPNLFQVLTSERDPHERWLTFTFPVDFDISMFKPQLEKEFKIYKTQSVEQEVAPVKDVLTLNCSVAYMSQCMSLNKCTAACQSMGAASFRWFHDGCCECVGDKCIKYGINESRCLRCPQAKLLSEDEADYGEEEDGLQA